ncbi:MAG: hypothetical protein IIW54_13170 [Lachnospiraceae bacterium]|nr:hypothetical protein [Lachnospiraceae bacterium]
MSELKEIREKALVNVKEAVEQNKKEIDEAYEWVMRLEYKARKEGLLALEYEAGFIPKDMPLCNRITEMVVMICDGTEPGVFAELMTLKFLANNYQGIDAILYFLYARSILMIQAGMSPLLIEELFNTVIPENLFLYRKRRSMWNEEKKQKIENWKSVLTNAEKVILDDISVQLQGLSEKEWKIVVSNKGFYGIDKVLPYLDETTLQLAEKHMNECRYYVSMGAPSIVQEQELQEMAEELRSLIIDLRTGSSKDKNEQGILGHILMYSDEEIQLFLKSIDRFTLALALKGVKEDVAECFYRNLPLRLKYLLQEEIEYMGPVRMCDVEEAQKKVLQKAKDTLGR